MRQYLLATATALGLAVAGGAANADPLTYTIWNGVLPLNHNATFPVPVSAPFASFVDNQTTLAFRDNNPQTGSVTFNDFMGSTSVHGTQSAASHLTAAQLATPMSTLDVGTDISTFIRITETYDITSPFTSTITHDDGAAIYLDGAGNGAQLCGNPLENSVNAQTCIFPAGLHSLTLLYTEDNGAPAILEVTLPTSNVVTASEPASLAIIGSALFGLGWLRRRRS
jgi:hypothetical protein